MIRGFRGKTPRIAESALISETASIIGDVEIGEKSSVWPGAVVRADCSVLEPGLGTRIGSNSHIEDNAVVHGTKSIGNNVVVGHGAVVEARSIGDNVLIGDNATVLTWVEIGNFCIVGAGSVVLEGMKIPDHSLVVGTPASLKGRLSPRQVALIEETYSGVIALMEEYRKDGA
ncbi:MAG: gamma carbonic anhydrase family protein [Chloroflexi bacterium]|nr:gamma carbonic anhydrase family protein [Chloroflexota bacterium]